LATEAVVQAQMDSRFSALWQACSAVPADGHAVWRVLSGHYAGPGRYYHNLQHVWHCLGELDLAGDRVPQPQQVELAIWFHDIVYDSTRSDNELRSAKLFTELASQVMHAGWVATVSALIVATTHRHPVQGDIEAWVVDIDLSSFGLPWEAYRADCEALRREQAWQPDETFYRNKRRFLHTLLARPYIFSTEYFQQRLEARARDNITRYLDELSAQGLGAE
jgi:predicted metal-dependent HD superfamily phosphohydrolase